MKEIVRKAYTLASTIHSDPATAHDVVATALARLPAAVAAQDKRLYYNGSARATKVWFEEEHLLQQLVFAISDDAERDDEERRSLGPHELLVRYIKHLVWISTRRSAFYVTIAVARLLYGLSTPKTAELYNRLTDDPDADKDDAYYRARKRVLVEELSARFPLMTTAAAKPDANARAVVERCLESFSPWDVACHDDSAQRELRQMHALLHPPCFRARLTEMGWLDPLPRLRVPQFAAGVPQAIPTMALSRATMCFQTR